MVQIQVVNEESEASIFNISSNRHNKCDNLNKCLEGNPNVGQVGRMEGYKSILSPEKKPSSIPSATLSTKASTSSATLSTKASTSSATLSTKASTSSATLSTKASTSSATLSTKASTSSTSAVLFIKHD
uniref:Uncharacterized protein n=1 Tax=Panagrolaimus superbus TaxID=310955 RepID=A0A914Y2K9_9BILA